MSDPVPWRAIVAAMSSDPALIAGLDQADAGLDQYAAMCGITLDTVTLRAMLHGLSAVQAVHVLTGRATPADPPEDFAREIVAASGRLMFVLARRLQADEAEPPPSG